MQADSIETRLLELRERRNASQQEEEGEQEEGGEEEGGDGAQASSTQAQAQPSPGSLIEAAASYSLEDLFLLFCGSSSV
jgi:hypothetical protein